MLLIRHERAISLRLCNMRLQPLLMLKHDLHKPLDDIYISCIINLCVFTWDGVCSSLNLVVTAVLVWSQNNLTIKAA